MPTYLDRSRWKPADSWRKIRTVRANQSKKPNPPLDEEARFNVFHTALEQSQQQFAAASSVGYESRALNLFYGLSQAGRALSAASLELQDETWRSEGHGISFKFDKLTECFWKQAVKICPRKINPRRITLEDTFSRTSIALESPYEDVKRVELGSLAAQLLEFTSEWPRFSNWPRPVDAFLLDFRPLQLRHLEHVTDTKQIVTYILQYPALRDLEINQDAGGAPLLDGEHIPSLLVKKDLFEQHGRHIIYVALNSTWVVGMPCPKLANQNVASTHL